MHFSGLSLLIRRILICLMRKTVAKPLASWTAQVAFSTVFGPVAWATDIEDKKKLWVDDPWVTFYMCIKVACTM